MIATIDAWCRDSEMSALLPQLNVSILALLFQDKNETAEALKRAVILDQEPDNLYVPFLPPGYPFDNRAFEDPFYLVINREEPIVDLPQLLRLQEQGILDGYIEKIFHTMTTVDSQGRKIIQKRRMVQLLKSQSLHQAKSRLQSRHQESVLLKKRRRYDFARVEKRENGRVHITKTLEKAINMDGHYRNAFQADRTYAYTRKKRKSEHLLIAIDISRSMATDARLAYCKQALFSLVHYLETRVPHLLYRIVAFHDQILPLSLSDLIAIQPTGLTYFPSLFEYTLGHFQKKQGYQNHLLLLTDGFPQHQKINDLLYQQLTLNSARRLAAIDLRLHIFLMKAQDKEHSGVRDFQEFIAGMVQGEVIESTATTILPDLHQYALTAWPEERS